MLRQKVSQGRLPVVCNAGLRRCELHCAAMRRSVELQQKLRPVYTKCFALGCILLVATLQYPVLQCGALHFVDLQSVACLALLGYSLITLRCLQRDASRHDTFLCIA